MKCVLKISCLSLCFKSYRVSNHIIKLLSQIKPLAVLFCFVLSDDYDCTLSTIIVKMIGKMCFLVQEPEENVNMINNYIQIMHKSAYLKTYLKKSRLNHQTNNHFERLST